MDSTPSGPPVNSVVPSFDKNHLTDRVVYTGWILGLLQFARGQTMTRRLTMLLAVLVALSGIAQAGKYEDKKHGFSITILRDWTQTPIQPNEKIEVAKFKDDRDRNFADMSIYRFAVSGSGVVTPDADGDLPDEADIPEIPTRWSLPDNAVDYLTAIVGRRARQMTGKDFVLPKPKNVKFGKAIKGDIYTFEFEKNPARFHY